MKILSWDVGIKHLAYCLIEYSENTKILDWDNINLLEDENLKCYGFINSENQNCNCDKQPKYEYINGNDKYYFCTLHKKQIEKIDKNSIDIKNYRGQATCEIIKSNKEVCGKPYGIFEKAYCSWKGIWTIIKVETPRFFKVF